MNANSIINTLVRTTVALENCNANSEWVDKYESMIDRIVDHYLPSGSGFDNGTRIISVSPTKCVFETSFHHMNDNGYYTKWTHHTVTVTPQFFGVGMKISGPNYRDIKTYIEDMFYDALNMDYVEKK